MRLAERAQPSKSGARALLSETHGECTERERGGVRALPSESAAEQGGTYSQLLDIRSKFLGSNVYHAQHDFVERIIGAT